MYENTFNQFDKSKAGIILSANKTTTIALNEPFYENSESEDFTYYSKQIQPGTKLKCTGRYFVDNYGVFWYQFITVDGIYCFLADSWIKNFDSYDAGYEATQKLFNRYINMDAYILENLLCASEIILTARKKGISVPASFENRLNDLNRRLYNRQNEIASSGLISDIKVDISSKYPYRKSLTAFNSDPQIAAIPLIAIGVIIVIGLIIYSTWSVTRGYLENKWLKEARKDVTLSDDLLSDMKTQLKPETWDEFKTGYDALLDRVDQLQKQAKQNSVMGIVKTGVIGLLAFIALDKFVINKK